VLESAKERASGKLTVYVTSTDPNAQLSMIGIPVASGQPPIDLGTMSKTDKHGNEFFLVMKHLPPVSSVEIMSTSGGALTASVTRPQ